MTTQPVVVISRQLPEEEVAPLRKNFDVRMWNQPGAMPREELIQAVQEANALWTVVADQVDEELFQAAPNLQVVSNMAVGYNNIDLAAAKKHDVLVTNTPGVLTDTTADLAFALLLATARNLMAAEDDLRQGKWKSWSPMGYTGMDVNGATLGIIGMGRIGEAVARRAKGFNMEVIYHNRKRRDTSEEMYGFTYAELDDLLQRSDFIVVLVPLTPQTYDLVGERELKLMKETAVLINVARGGIVNEEALYHALKSGEIWAAGLDVYEKEPIDMSHPLLTLPNVTMLPHIGSASIKTRTAMMRLNVSSITAVLEGRVPENLVR